MELQEALKLLKYISENDITEKEYSDMLDSKEAKLINGYIEELQDRIDKAIEYTKQFANGKTSSIDEWENVELVLENILKILKGEQ